MYYPEFDQVATPADALAEFGRNAGSMFPDQAWLLHDWDVWVKNPDYRGPAVPHPEEAEEALWAAMEAEEDGDDQADDDLDVIDDIPF